MPRNENTTQRIEKSDLKIAVMHLSRLSDQNGSYVIEVFIKVIHTDKLKPGEVSQQKNYWKGFMAIFDGSVGQEFSS